jgi:pilus assembly protein CpaF
MIPHELHAQNLSTLLAPLAPLLARSDVSEIMINGPHCVYVESRGRVQPSSCRFASSGALLAALRGVAQYAGRNFGPDAPILEARLPDGSRIEAVIPPAAPDGPVASIRRFTGEALDLEQLVARGGVSAEGADLLLAIVTQRRNVLVSGGTGSGKTSLLNALARQIEAEQRVLVIEDARELRLAHEHVVHLEARPPDAHGRGEISVRQLFHATLRLRPDRIVVGEIRGAEALELIAAMTSGHAGCMSTIHASSPSDALARLETLALMAGLTLPLWALRAQVASAIDVIVQTARGADGVRRITRVVEVDIVDSEYVLVQRYAGTDAV